MHRFDLISGAPKTFIFERSSNKTNLGGLFTIIFIALILVIINNYLYEYFTHPKYRFLYTYDDKYYKDEDLDKIYNNTILYPELTFHFELTQTNITKNIKIQTHEGENILIGEEYKYKKKVADLNFVIYYKCQNETNCDLRKSDEEGVKYYQNINIYDLRFVFLGYYCDHQNDTSPIKRDEDYEYFPFSVSDRIDYYLFHWKIFQYLELSSISGMFKDIDINTGGEIYKPIIYSIPSDNFPPVLMNETDENNITTQEYYKLISIIQFNKDNFGYFDVYSRSKISIFDPIANICSLIITLYGIITFIFCRFYSNSFDNYKIIEKIISNKFNLEKKVKIELKDENKNEEKEDLLLDKDNKDKDNLNIIKESNDMKEENFEEKREILNLPKFRFYHYFFNNVYCRKCCNNSSQEIISLCNELITKYYSIDSVIYSQLKLENLFKDYKWNDPKLNRIENNDLIAKIKNLSINY